MLPRIPRLPRVSWQFVYWKRNYATTTEISTNTTPSTLFSQTFKKVTAYPFDVDPWRAQAMMDVAAALLMSKHLSLAVKFVVYNDWQMKRGYMIPHLMSFCSYVYYWYLKMRSRSRPLRVEGLYYPSWKVWGAFKIGTLTRNQRIVIRNFLFWDKYMPGCETPRDLATIGGPEFPDSEECGTLPLAECLSPFGLDVECLPFTISPFPLLEMAKSIPFSESKITFRGELVAPHSLQTEMLAAFPVLLPHYSCKYTHPATKGEPEWQFQIFTCGHGKAPAIASLFPSRRGLGPVLEKYIADKHQTDEGFTSIEGVSLGKLVDILVKAPALRNDDDVCIRVFKKEELEPILNYMTIKKKLNKLCDVNIRTWPTTAIKRYKEEVAKLNKRAQDYLPSWWNQSSLAKYGAIKTKPQEKDKPLRSRSSPISNLEVDPDTASVPPSSRKKTKGKNK